MNEQTSIATLERYHRFGTEDRNARRPSVSLRPHVADYIRRAYWGGYCGEPLGMTKRAILYRGQQ